MSWEFCTNLSFLNWDAIVSMYSSYSFGNFNYSTQQTPKFTIFSDKLQLKLGNRAENRSSLSYPLFSFDNVPNTTWLKYPQLSFNSSPSYQSVFQQQLCFNYQTTPTQTVQTDDKVQTGNEEQAVSVTPTSSKLEGFDISKYPKAEVDAAIKLYQQMGLDKRGLNKEVFLAAVIGYNRLTDKGNGYLGIFDTTQSLNRERYYLIDIKNQKFIGQTAIRTGSKSKYCSSVQAANRSGSNATLSGFEKVGNQYRSSKWWTYGINLHGLESGINDKAYSKRCVAHYTKSNYSAGCKAITGVYTNGKFDATASLEKLQKFFPTGAIIFTSPMQDNYWQSSKIFA